MPQSALIAMSGGVDSSAAARLSINEGLDCAGAIMKLHPFTETPEKDARKIAENLKISFFVFDFTCEFERFVISPFVNTYRDGKTPNPCVECNRHLKFGLFLEKAREIGKDYVVTGHYAQIERDSGTGRFLLKKGADAAKDQSYFLYTLTQYQLSHTLFPLGKLTKAQVREIARENGFNNAQKPESQDICFVPEGGHSEFIESFTGRPDHKGAFEDTAGEKLGEHRGITSYTVGQRRGLGLAMPYPAYVLEINPDNNTVIVGRNEELFAKTLTARSINIIAQEKLEKPIRASVKIRYKHTAQPATVRQTDSDTLQIEFDEPQRAITKGQSAVIYDGDIVIGGGIIV